MISKLQFYLVCLFTAFSVIEGFNFPCSYKPTEFNKRYTFEYRCSVAGKLVEVENSTFITDKDGSNMRPFNSIKDVVTVVVFGDKTYEKLPITVTGQYPNLRHFHWTDGRLNTITAEDLKPFPFLQTLNFMHNNVKHLDGNLLKYQTDLDFVDFTGNLIESIGYGLLDNQNRMKTVRFHGNVCISRSTEKSSEIGDLVAVMEIHCKPKQINAPDTLEKSCNSKDQDCQSIKYVKRP